MRKKLARHVLFLPVFRAVITPSLVSKIVDESSGACKVAKGQVCQLPTTNAVKLASWKDQPSPFWPGMRDLEQQRASAVDISTGNTNQRGFESGGSWRPPARHILRLEFPFGMSALSNPTHNPKRASTSPSVSPLKCSLACKTVACGACPQI